MMEFYLPRKIGLTGEGNNPCSTTLRKRLNFIRKQFKKMQTIQVPITSAGIAMTRCKTTWPASRTSAGQLTIIKNGAWQARVSHIIQGRGATTQFKLMMKAKEINTWCI